MGDGARSSLLVFLDATLGFIAGMDRSLIKGQIAIVDVIRVLLSCMVRERHIINCLFRRRFFLSRVELFFLQIPQFLNVF